MMHLLHSENRSTPFPLWTGRVSVKHHLCYRTDRLIGIIQRGNEFLMSSKISPMTPFQMARKQIQGVAVAHGTGMFR
jgi:hypothetical protein